MATNQVVNLKDYKELIDTVSKVEYQKFSQSLHLIDYSEIVNLATHTLYILFKNNPPEKYNQSYLSTAIKWSVRNEVRRRYKWYTLKTRKREEIETSEESRENVYKAILSIDEMADAETPVLIKSETKNPEEFLELIEIKRKIQESLKKLPPREKEFIEQRFFNDKKLKDISVEFNISQSRISRIIQSGLNRIKKDLAIQGITE